MTWWNKMPVFPEVHFARKFSKMAKDKKILAFAVFVTALLVTMYIGIMKPSKFSAMFVMSSNKSARNATSYLVSIWSAKTVVLEATEKEDEADEISTEDEKENLKTTTTNTTSSKEKDTNAQKEKDTNAQKDTETQEENKDKNLQEKDKILPENKKKTQKDEAISPSDKDKKHQERDKTRTQDKNQKIKLQNKPQHIPHNATKMTFNSSLLVYCKHSPFVVCPNRSEDKNKVQNPEVANKTFNIVFLRRPAWLKSNTDSFALCKSSINNKCVLQGEKVADITEDTDVVHVYGVNLPDSFKPPKRWPHQLYAVSSWESPPHTHASFLSNSQSVWNRQFNITISYRSDADVFTPYLKLKFDPIPIDQRPDYYEIARKKTKSVAWFVSNCRVPSMREDYVKEMQKYIDVDIYGACGQPCVKKPDSPCNKALSTTYKFYLSFENSLCTGYISEKFLKVFTPENYVIPVVRGWTDYDKLFPEFTFINAGNFKTAKDLALYLKDLGSDWPRYSKYLEYKDLYGLSNEGLHSYACNLCQYLHSENNKPKVYDMKKWMGDGQCLSVNDIV